MAVFATLRHFFARSWYLDFEMRVLLFIAFACRVFAGTDEDLNTLLMRSTFEIGGRTPTGFTIGTGFVVGKPYPEDPSKGWYILVTAAHVLDGVPGDYLTINLRRQKPDGTYDLVPSVTPLRANGKNLYVTHDSADTAALYVRVPIDCKFPLMDFDSFMIKETEITSFELHPGDELLALGYPLGASANAWGFPILRSGKIASYPLTPLSAIKTFLFDFHVFSGNSGGPVYINLPNSRFARSKEIPLGGFVSRIVGLVSQQLTSTLVPGNPRLEIGVVVPAEFIRETIALLPQKPQPEVDQFAPMSVTPAVLR